MNPVAKFNSIIISVTTVCMYVLWKLLNGIMFQNNTYAAFSLVITFLSSLGFYRLINNLLGMAFRKVKLFKRFILGPFYLEGAWVGFFVGKNNKVRLIYEQFEQELDSLVIKGYSYNEDGSSHGDWIAKNPVIDNEIGKMAYYYEAKVNTYPAINQGFAEFNFRRTCKSDIISEMTGFSSDLYTPEKVPAYEKKVMGCKKQDERFYIDEARKVYESNKDKFSKV